MAKLFQISIPDGMTALKLDSQGHASVQYTVRYLGALPVDAQAVLTQVPVSPADPNHPVQKGWVKVEGKTQRHFEANGEDTFKVSVAVPSKSALPGTYSFRLDVVSVARPDEGDSSSVLKFEVKAADKPKTKWPLIIAIVAAVLIAGGIGTWLALRTSGVPKVEGMNISDATTALTKANISITQPITTKVGDASNADIVLTQSVAAGTPIKKDMSIKLTVGAQMIAVPNLSGMTIQQATNALAPNLILGSTTVASNGTAQPGQIWQQQPAAGGTVQSNGTVNVTLAPATVTVPNLTGVSLDTAIKTISQDQLTFAGHQGDLVTQNTTGQSPAAGQSVQAGTAITLIFPASPYCFPVGRCFVNRQSTLMMNKKVFVR